MNDVMKTVQPFMYGIRTPEGLAWLDEYCVDREPGELERGQVAALNEGAEDQSEHYQTVALYTAGQVSAALSARLPDSRSPSCDGTFRRENRYTVIKHADLNLLDQAGLLRPEELVMLTELTVRLKQARENAGKPVLRTVVVESTWPEYEPVWLALKLRTEGGDESVS